MTTSADTPLAPDDAFGVLGNETRMAILQELAAADGPLPFSKLRDRVGVRDSGQFNYHLDKLAGHFVGSTDDGYELRRAGERIIEAVLSGAVTEVPVIEPTRIEEPCQLCGGTVQARYHAERIELYCTECGGVFGETDSVNSPRGDELGYLGALRLPPAGLQGRTVDDIVEAAFAWGGLEYHALGCGVCPRCSAALDRSVSVCREHDASNGVCDECGRRYASDFRSECTNCIFDVSGLVGILVHANTRFLAFLTSRGVNPLSSDLAVTANYDEELLSTKPFEARFTFTIDGDALSLTIDDDLEVVEVTEQESAANG